MPNMEKVIKAWECCNPFNRKCNECPYEKDCYHDGISRHMVADAIALLNENEPVVRCKDCKFHHPSEKLNKCWCEKDFIEGYHNRDWFCADGVKKDD